jgi:hypothetical protein
MDYRNYDRGRSLLPRFIRRNVRYLRPIGIVLCLIGIIVPFLMVIKLLQSSYILNFLAYICLFLGPIAFLVSLAFDGYVDRSE